MAFRPAFTSAFSPAFRPAYNTDAGGAPFVGLLELYAGAAVAYSLRSLVTEGNPKVLNVRRSSDQAEAEFFAKEVSTIAAWVGAGNDGFVETWYDQSGNGNNAVQPSASLQPKIVSGGSLVAGGLAFDGVNDRLSFETSSVALSSNDFFVTSVLKVLEGDGVDVTPVGNVSGNRFLISLDYDGNVARMRADDGSFLTESFLAGEPTGNILATAQRVSNTVTLFHQSSNQTTFNATGESFTLGNLGQRSPTQYSKHLLNEIIVYPSDQSANRVGIEANIKKQYDI